MDLEILLQIHITQFPTAHQKADAICNFYKRLSLLEKLLKLLFIFLTTN